MKSRAQIIYASGPNEPSSLHPAADEVHRILGVFLTKQLGTSYSVSPTLFLFTHDGLLSTTLECHKAYGQIYPEVPYMSRQFSVAGGALMEVHVPFKVDNMGQLNWVSGQSSIEGAAGALTEAGIRMPFDLLDAKLGVRYIGDRQQMRSAGDDLARFTTPSKIVPAIKDLCKRMGLDEPRQMVTNPLLRAIKEACEKVALHCEWLPADRSIARQYNIESDTFNPYSSCMAGRPESFFRIYNVMRESGQLDMVLLKDGGGDHRGRALCWTDESGVRYLDRLYCPEDGCGWSTAAVNAFADFCKAEGITHTVYSRTNKHIPALVFEGNLTILNDNVGGGSDYYPYSDSLYFLGGGGVSTRCHPCDLITIGELRNTDGSLDTGDYDGYGEEEEGMVELHSGYEHPESDSFNYGGEWYALCEGVWVGGGLIPRSVCQRLDQTYYGSDVFALDDDSTQCHDGLWCLTEHVVQDTHGDNYHEDEVQWCSEAGAYYLPGETVELHDGDYAPTAYAIEVNGEWYLIGTEPADDEDGGCQDGLDILSAMSTPATI